MSWQAEFCDGPLAGVEREWFFTAGPPLRTLCFVELPDPFGWSLVGADGFAPDPPWSGQVDYELVEIRDSDPDALALYRCR